MQGQSNTFDATTAGLQFTSPSVTLTSQNMGVNGGLSFDMPLAALTMSQNRALAFVGANTQGIGEFLMHTQMLGGNSLDLTITQRGAEVTGIGRQAVDSMYHQNMYAFNTAQNIYGHATDTTRYIARRSSRRGCFITTAVCDVDGLPDDCAELTTLREWRDTVLPGLPGGKALTKVYYMVAPDVVEIINNRPDRFNLLQTMRLAYIEPAITAIKQGDHTAAFCLYCELVEFAVTCVEDTVNGR